MRMFAFALGMLGIASSAQGQPAPLGDEFQVSSSTLSILSHPAAAMKPDGSFVVVWASAEEPLPCDLPVETCDIRGQRFSSDGSRLGDEFLVNAYTTHPQEGPALAMNDAGDFVAVWTSDGLDGDGLSVHGQLFSQNGSPLGAPFQANTYTTNNQGGSSVAMAPAGNFLVVWSSNGQDGDASGVFGQHFASDGTRAGDEFQINTYTERRQARPDVAFAADGDFVIVWNSPGEYGAVIHGRRFNSAGDAVGEEFQVSTETTLSNVAADVAMNSAGEFMVAWYSFYLYTYNSSILGQLFDADGAKVGGEFAVQTYTYSRQGGPSVDMADDGSFVVVWSKAVDLENLNLDVFGQQYASNGSPLGGRFQINTETAANQYLPTIAMDDGKRFVVAWESRYQASGDGVFGQQFTLGHIFSDGFESGDTSAWN